MSSLLVFGAGGHGKVVADAAIASGVWERIAFADDTYCGRQVMGIPVAAAFSDADKLTAEYPAAVVALGDNVMRAQWTQRLRRYGYALPVIRHPSATVSPYAVVGEGSVILALAVINPSARIGVGCIINTSSCIEHDCTIGDYVHISPGVILGGEVTIGDLSWVCLGAHVINGVSIGERSVLAAGSTLIRSMEERAMYAGSPAIRKKSKNIKQFTKRLDEMLRTCIQHGKMINLENGNDRK